MPPFDPLAEHRWFCPVAWAGSGKAGWQQAVERLETRPAAAATTTKTADALALIRRLM